MDTVTIDLKEYKALVFAKNTANKVSAVKKSFVDTAFGIFKKSVGSGSSVSIVNKLLRTSVKIIKQ